MIISSWICEIKCSSDTLILYILVYNLRYKISPLNFHNWIANEGIELVVTGRGDIMTRHSWIKLHKYVNMKVNFHNKYFKCITFWHMLMFTTNKILSKTIKMYCARSFQCTYFHTIRHMALMINWDCHKFWIKH